MRSLWFAAIVLLPAAGLSAQMTPGHPTQDSVAGARPGHVPGIGESLPRSDRASNIGPGTERQVAPSLPQPAAGESAGAGEFIRTAREALAAGRTGLAQEALEMAETRLLDRVVPGGVIMPSDERTVMALRQARQALGEGRSMQAMQILDASGR
jgi:hypothetical protein